MKRNAVFAILLVGVSACATGREPAVRTVTVNVPTHEPCAIAEPAEPSRVDTDEALRAAPDIFERVKLLIAGREQRIASEREARTWGRACAS